MRKSKKNLRNKESQNKLKYTSKMTIGVINKIWLYFQNAKSVEKDMINELKDNIFNIRKYISICKWVK